MPPHRFPTVCADGLLQRVLRQLCAGMGMRDRDDLHPTMRSWVDYELYIPLVTSAPYFFWGYGDRPLVAPPATKSRRPHSAPKLDLKDYKALLKRCRARFPEAEIAAQFVSLDHVDVGKCGAAGASVPKAGGGISWVEKQRLLEQDLFQQDQLLEQDRIAP